MHEISWLVILFYSIPECALVSWVGLLLINYRPAFSKIILVASIYGPLVYMIRRLPMLYGLHTIILIIIVVILLTLIFRISMLKAATAVILGVIISLSLETISIPMIIAK
ncbi:MAG: hypothetical protein M1486_01060, partial [Gammaproteobacteria bacterium]|nr:hypothetical protein [Gammaproteobacteria bacterium]